MKNKKRGKVRREKDEVISSLIQDKTSQARDSSRIIVSATNKNKELNILIN